MVRRHRLTPWLLVSLLVVGTAAGAVLGTAKGSTPLSPSQWIAQVLAASEKAGSAHFSYTHVTSSLNPELRGSLSGHGEVDFITDHVRVTEVDRDITFSSSDDQPLRPVSSMSTTEAIVIGGTLYQANAAFAGKYHVIPFHHLPPSQGGFFLALNASVALDVLRGPNAAASVTNLGSAKIDGVSTTQYEVEYAPLHVCAPHQAPQVLNQRPSRVWLDGAGRLKRVRSTLYFNGHVPGGAKLPAAFDGLPLGPTTTVATLTFSHYGVPVRVDAPPKSALSSEAGTSTGLAIAGRDTCHA